MQRAAENLHRPTPIPSLDSMGSRRASGTLSVSSIVEEEEVEEHDSATSLEKSGDEKVCLLSSSNANSNLQQLREDDGTLKCLLGGTGQQAGIEDRAAVANPEWEAAGHGAREHRQRQGAGRQPQAPAAAVGQLGPAVAGRQRKQRGQRRHLPLHRQPAPADTHPPGRRQLLPQVTALPGPAAVHLRSWLRHLGC